MLWMWSYPVATRRALSELDPGRIARRVLWPVHRAWTVLKIMEGTGPNDLYLHNTTALPKNPTVKGSSKEERSDCMDAACIEPATKQCIAEWDMGKDPDHVSEVEWIAWFEQGYDVDHRVQDTHEKRIKSAS
ncbi:hypothetical protein H257_13197 [Aphanomyces astaci]|uniref:Uncharacterized protein n=1 Tax=Aphanomyces astaci TaxID=112090 RepID=W4FXM5_APHAT|nr:hypothetical protein H257_13197 [Aphanomyces astaci]ETV71534.1 hypothetical protein H257_13197 [Aphanomyces astaci]|eukprot:XP_009838967.1 hypothetical protein H257_13197 [Aphanomyces astaci]